MKKIKGFWIENKIFVIAAGFALIIILLIYLYPPSGIYLVVFGVFLGWLLSFFTDIVKEKIKKRNLRKSLLNELNFNKGLVSYTFLYFPKLLFKEPKLTMSENDKKLFNIVLMLALKKEGGWGFATSVYEKVTSEGILMDLTPVLCGEIMDIYRTISLLQRLGIPKDGDNAGWSSVKEKLLKLENSLNLVINNFYASKEDWTKIVKQELQKIKNK